jgi:hypothetical protein
LQERDSTDLKGKRKEGEGSLGKGTILRRNVKEFSCVHIRRMRKAIKGIFLSFQESLSRFHL